MSGARLQEEGWAWSSGSSLAISWLHLIQWWVQNSDPSDGSCVVGALDWLGLIFFLTMLGGGGAVVYSVFYEIFLRLEVLEQVLGVKSFL